jgi:hypothetical protein
VCYNLNVQLWHHKVKLWAGELSNRGFIVSKGKVLFLHHRIQTSYRAYLPSYHQITGVSSDDKVTGAGPNHSSPYFAELALSYTSTPPINVMVLN